MPTEEKKVRRRDRSEGKMRHCVACDLWEENNFLRIRKGIHGQEKIARDFSWKCESNEDFFFQCHYLIKIKSSISSPT